jgi:hypothetical protein
MIWNLPIQTIELGLSNIDVFVGYTQEISEDLNVDGIFNDGSDETHPLLSEVDDDFDYNKDGDKLDINLSEDLNGNAQFDLTFNVLEHAARVSGELTEADLNLAGAIGLFLDEASLGMLLGSAAGGLQRDSGGGAQCRVPEILCPEGRCRHRGVDRGAGAGSASGRVAGAGEQRLVRAGAVAHAAGAATAAGDRLCVELPNRHA